MNADDEREARFQAAYRKFSDAVERQLLTGDRGDAVREMNEALFELQESAAITPSARYRASMRRLHQTADDCVERRQYLWALKARVYALRAGLFSWLLQLIGR